MLVVHGDLIADPAGTHQLDTVAHQRRHRAAAVRVDGAAVSIVTDGAAGQGFPRGRLASGLRRADRVCPPPERRHVAGQPGDGVAVVFDQDRDRRAVRVEDRPGRRFVEVDGDDVGSAVRQRVPHHDVAVDGARQQCHRVVAGGPAEFPRIAPAGEQVEVHLVGFRSGDGVVVRTVGQLHPGLGQGGLRIRGAGEQSREHREPFGFQHDVLGGPVGLLGVDVRHVLAGVDRVHVPRLRRRLGATGCEFGTHGGEELPRQRAHEAGPGVAGRPVAVNLGDPFVRRGVVGTHRQQHIAGQRNLFQLGERCVCGRLGLLQ